MEILTHRDMKHFNFLARYKATGKRFYRPPLGSLSNIVFVGKDKTRYLQQMTTNLQNVHLNSQNGHTANACNIIPNHYQSIIAAANGWSMYTQKSIFDIYQTEGNNFQLCIIDKEIRFINIGLNDGQVQQYLVWPLKTRSENDETLFAVAIPRSRYSRNNLNSPYWELVEIQNMHQLISLFETILNDLISGKYITSYTINGSDINHFAKEFHRHLPQNPKLDAIKFDPTKRVTVNSSKLLRNLKKQFKNNKSNVQSTLSKNRSIGSAYNRGKACNMNTVHKNSNSKVSSLINDIQELDCGSINGLFDLMMTNVYHSLFYAKLYPNNVQTQIYIDKFNAVYHSEFVMLLEIKNVIKNKIHKYGLTLVTNENKYSLNCINPANVALMNIRLACNSTAQESFVHAMYSDSNRSFYDSLASLSMDSHCNYHYHYNYNVPVTPLSRFGIGFTSSLLSKLRWKTDCEQNSSQTSGTKENSKPLWTLVQINSLNTTMNDVDILCQNQLRFSNLNNLHACRTITAPDRVKNMHCSVVTNSTENGIMSGNGNSNWISHYDSPRNLRKNSHQSIENDYNYLHSGRNNNLGHDRY